MLTQGNAPRNKPMHGPHGYVYQPVIDAGYAMMPDDDDADPTPPTTHDDEPTQLCFEFRYRRSGL